MRTKQLSLLDAKTKKRYGRTAHGGIPTKGKRKLERPLGRRNWIHLNLKSQRAKGQYSFLTPKNRILVEKILRDKAKKFGVKIADFANVGNHLHIKLRITSRELFQKFLKAITALIARKITGAKKGKAFGKFWDSLAYTRVLKSYTEELNLKGYFEANRWEAQYGQAARDLLLKRWNNYVYKEQGWRNTA